MSGSRDTIFACATAAGRAAIAVVRLSGTEAIPALRTLSGRVPIARRLARADLRAPGRAELLDSALVVQFPAPNSYTGEDMVEVHLHGGRAVLMGLLQALAGIPGLRPAEPGEFTRRAFENGKLDLTEAEAVADLVNADTAAQQRQALRQLSGELGRLYENWRLRLLRTLAHLEAFIDFPDEELPTNLVSELSTTITALIGEIDGHLADNRGGERLRDGIAIAILGPPNAGKSSLLNALARRDVAITAETAGTTRDVIEVHLDLGGYPVLLADTAGLRGAADQVEVEGVRRAVARAQTADLKLLVLDASNPLTEYSLVGGFVDADTIVIANKMDIAGAHADWADRLGGTGAALRLSVRTGEGMSELLGRLTTEIAARMPSAGAAPVITRARHRAALEECVTALRRYENGKLPELAAEDLRVAARALGRITGRVDVEDILDVIFRDFCIGK
ncbi:MAG TPA: tRNA uridine-5-carboxymethylaminomethyl(34) synthesis GTPase MnmE [Stellaceae bacterium]|nr:tRNA uridine-5-carboxymethylaminomethyl(34) synthesis GTPase MnmE [Stellaceae bacterium]